MHTCSVCVCVCVCVHAHVRERDCVSECVCVCVRVCEMHHLQIVLMSKFVFKILNAMFQNES